MGGVEDLEGWVGEETEDIVLELDGEREEAWWLCHGGVSYWR